MKCFSKPTCTCIFGDHVEPKITHFFNRTQIWRIRHSLSIAYLYVMIVITLYDSYRVIAHMAPIYQLLWFVFKWRNLAIKQSTSLSSVSWIDQWDMAPCPLCLLSCAALPRKELQRSEKGVPHTQQKAKKYVTLHRIWWFYVGSPQPQLLMLRPEPKHARRPLWFFFRIAENGDMSDYWSVASLTKNKSPAAIFFVLKTDGGIQKLTWKKNYRRLKNYFCRWFFFWCRQFIFIAGDLFLVKLPLNWLAHRV